MMKRFLRYFVFSFTMLLITGFVTFAAPAATITINQPTCEGDNGSATITIAEGTKLEDFTYYFSGIGTEEDLPSSPYTITGLNPGVEYTIEVNLLGSQVGKEVFVLTEGSSPSITSVNTQNAANCNSVGEIEIWAPDAVEFSIDGGADWTSNDVFGASAGTYPASKIMVRDANGCEASWKGDNVVILDEAEEIVNNMTYSVVPPTCIGETDGEIVFQNLGQGYEYRIDDGNYYEYGQATSDFDEQEGGETHQLTVSWDRQCTYSVPSIDLPNPQLATIDDVEATTSSIAITASENAGSDNGIARMDMGNIIYSIDNGDTFQESNDFSGLTPGDYNVVIKYGECETSYSGNPVTIAAETYNVTFNVTYDGNPIDAANITFNGEELLTFDTGSVTFENVEAGTHSYTVTYNGFNDATGTVSVTDADATENVVLTPAPLDAATHIETDNGYYAYGSTLTALHSGCNNTGTLQFQWLRGSTPIPGVTSNTYTVVQEDIGEQIYVNITSTVQTGTLIDYTSVIAKAFQYARPAAPTMASNTSTSITLTAVDGCEYLMGEDAPQASPVFTDLSPDTDYDFRQRFAETETHYASSWSSKTYFSTTEAGPNALTGTVTVTGGNQYLDEIEAIVTETNNTGDLSYQWKRDGSPISGATSNLYTLTADDIATTVTVDVTSDVETGTISGSAGVIEKANQAAPAAPTMASNTSSSITLTAVDGCEYCEMLMGGSWQDSPIFTGLIANSGYEFIQRYKETETHKASSMSAQVQFSTQEEVQPIVNISDANFKAALLANASINTNSDDEIQVSEAEAFEGRISVSALGISDLTGIETFVNITGLTCPNNSITTIDLSNSPNLRTLYCNDNQITSINLNNTDLRVLNCNSNQLTGLDLSAFPNLVRLYCESNDITSLNVNGCTQLVSIYCCSNELTSIDVSTCIDLTKLQCHANNLTNANIANGACSSYETMYLQGNSGLTCVQVDDSFTPPASGSDGWVYDSGVNFSADCSALPSSDATLADLKIGSTTIDGFASDIYDYEKINPYCTIPQKYVAATATDDNATVNIEQAFPANNDVATITVTAEDGTTQLTYTVAFSSTDEIVITSVTPIDADCPGDYAEGGFEVVASGGNGTLEYGFYTTDDVGRKVLGQDYFEEWTPEASYSGLLKANYEIKVRDEDGCVAIWNEGNTETFNVPELTLSASKTDVTIKGANDGTITVNASFSNSSSTIQYALFLEEEETLYRDLQTSNVFENLPPNNYLAVVVASIDGCADAVESVPVEITEPDVNALTGTVTITGTTKYGEILTANLNESNNTGILSYQWVIHDNNIVIPGATESSYTLTETDIDNTIRVDVRSSVETGKLESAPTSSIEKADQSAPAAPTLASKSHNSVELNPVTGCQYAIGGGTWQASSSFAGLSAETDYSFTQRYAETATHNASGASVVLTVTTNSFDINSVVNDLQVNGISITDFSNVETEYTVEIPREFEGIPETEVFTINSGVAITVNDAVEIPGTTTITVTSPDGSQTLVYTIHFVWALANDASLQGITINSEELSDFDADVFEYTLSIENPENIPQVSALVSDDNANVDILQAAGIPGQAIITVTAEDGKTQQVYTINFETETSSDNFNIANIKAYPNPTLGIVNVEVPGQSKISKVCLINVTGKVIAVKNKMSAHFVTFDLTNLKQGVYFITIENEEKNQIVKRVIKK